MFIFDKAYKSLYFLNYLHFHFPFKCYFVIYVTYICLLLIVFSFNALLTLANRFQVFIFIVCSLNLSNKCKCYMSYVNASLTSYTSFVTVHIHCLAYTWLFSTFSFSMHGICLPLVFICSPMQFTTYVQK